ncbi:MAG: ZIP family metal transporter [Clostridiales bacterium]
MGIGEVLIISFLAGIATLLGGILGLLVPVEREGCLGLVIGFGVGVMIGISLFSLMPQAYYLTGSPFTVGFGFVLGIIFMVLCSYFVNNKLKSLDTPNESAFFGKIGLLMAMGIGFHNLPEGIAMGAGFQGSTYLGFVVAFALMLHNIPEGISIGAPLKKSGVKKVNILLITALAGSVTPLGALIGWLATDGSVIFLSIGMGFAAGAMIYISFAQVLKITTKFLDLGIFFGILLTFFLT